MNLFYFQNVFHLFFVFLRSENPDQQPLIVIDSGCFDFINPLEESILGGRYSCIIERIQNFFQKIIDAGAKLVFFKNSKLYVDDQADKWCQRQDVKYKKQIEVMDMIKAKKPFSEIVSCLANDLSMMGNSSNITSTVMKEFGEFHRIIQNLDYGCCVASHATDNNALAVISNNSNFLIYEGNWKYWSLRDIRMEEMTTIEFSRLALLKDLGLTWKNMPLFATLCGNDFVKFEELKPWHAKIVRSFRMNAQAQQLSIAKFVKQFQGISSNTNDREFKYLASDVFKNCEEPEEYADLLKRSVNSYNYEYVSIFFDS